MTITSVPDWQPDTYETLEGVLTNLLSHPSSNLIHTLHNQLIRLRSDVTTAFHDPTPTAPGLKDLSSGNVLIHGNSQMANQAFCSSVEILANLLNVHEGIAATLYSYGLKERPRFGDRTDLEVSIYMYFSERERLLSSIELMISQFQAHQSEMATEAYHIIETFLQDLLSSNSANPLVPYLLKTILDDSRRIDSLAGSDEKQTTASAQKLIDAKVPVELIQLYVSFLKREKKLVGSAILSIAFYRRLSEAEAIQLLEYLQTADETDASCWPLILSFFATIGLKNSKHEVPEHLNRWYLSQTGFDKIRSLLQNTSSWKTASSAQGALWLSWASTLDWMMSSPELVDQQVRSFVEREGDQMKRQFMQTVGCKSDLYVYLHTCMTKFRNSVNSQLKIVSSAAFSDTAVIGSDDVDEDIHELAIIIFEHIISLYVISMKRFLRQLLASDQDAVAAYDDKHDVARPHQTATSETRPLTAWESLLQVIQSVFEARTDAALEWWYGGDLFNFIKLASDVWTPRFIIGFLNLISSLARGPQSAFRAHEILSADGMGHLGYILWSTFFRTLNAYIEKLSQSDSSIELKPSETKIIHSFLHLLGVIAKYSPQARRVLCENQHYRAIHTLFQLLVRRVQIDMKAALLDTIAKFCWPSEECGDIAAQVWLLLEQCQIIPTIGLGITRPWSFEDGSTTINEGLIFDIRDVEMVQQSYPETLAFLRLLISLLSNPKTTYTQVIYETLGSSDRIGGIGPYISFVVNQIFLRLDERPFVDPKQKSEILACCLRIFSLCLQNLDFSPILHPMKTESVAINGAGFGMNQDGVNGASAFTPIRSIGLHPGFSLLCQLLSGSHLTSRIFAVLDDKSDTSVPLNIKKNQFNTESTVFTLFLIFQILHMQRSFLEIVAPAIAESGDALFLNMPVSMTGIDQLLAYHKQAVVHIATLIGNQHNYISYLAIRITSLLSQSPVFTTYRDSSSTAINRLVALLQSSEASNQIIQAFVDRLEMDEDETDTTSLLPGPFAVAFDDLSLPSSSLENAWDSSRPGLVHAIRTAILDMFVVNIASNQYPTVAHFLLGYNVNGKQSLLNGTESRFDSSRAYCLQTILRLLSIGIPHENRASATSQTSSPFDTGDAVREPLFVTHPRLAEKCYRLIYHLCVQKQTGKMTMRFLRSNEDFFWRQLKAMPVTTPSLTVNSGARIQADMPIVYQRGWLMKTIALELHMTATSGQRSHTLRLLQLLLSVTQGYTKDSSSKPVFSSSYLLTRGGIAEDDNEGEERDAEVLELRQSGFGNDTTQFEQPLTKVLDFFYSLSLSDPSFTPLDLSMTVFADMQLNDFMIVNDRGTSQFDIKEIHAAMIDRLDILGKSGNTTVIANRPEIISQIRDICRLLVDLNVAQEISHSRSHVSQGWSQLVRVTVSECYELLPLEVREIRTFELLSGILQHIGHMTPSPTIGQWMSEVVLALMTRLFQDAQYRRTVESNGFVSPQQAESLQTSVLRGIIDNIVAPGTSLVMRGNYYATLVTFLRYMDPTVSPSGPVSQPPVSALRNFVSCLGVILSGGDRLLEILCSDAADAELVWRISALSTLTYLCHVANVGSSIRAIKGNGLLQFFGKRNFWGYFVRSILTEDDANLQKLLESQTDNINAKYAYELKMSFLLRVAESSSGAERLIEYGLFETLQECKFIHIRPEADMSLQGSLETGLLPSREEMFHDVFSPLLQLVVAVMSHCDIQNTSAFSRIIKFASLNQSMFTTILRDRTLRTNFYSLTELHLVTSFFAKLGPLVSNIEVKTAGSASYHSLLLGLFRKYGTSSKWSETLSATNEIEEQKMGILRTYTGSHLSLFVEDATHVVDDILHNLGLYFVQVSVPSLHGSSKHDFCPPLQDLLAVAKQVADRLVSYDSQIKVIQHKLSDIRQIPIEEINEVSKTISGGILEEMTTAQRQELVVKEFRSVHQSLQKSLSVCLRTIEMIMQLIVTQVNARTDSFTPDVGQLVQGVIEKANQAETTLSQTRQTDTAQTDDLSLSQESSAKSIYGATVSSDSDQSIRSGAFLELCRRQLLASLS